MDNNLQLTRKRHVILDFANICGYNELLLAWKERPTGVHLNLYPLREANPGNWGRLHQSIYKPWEKSIKISLFSCYFIYNRTD
jgi:hypothetical protein